MEECHHFELERPDVCMPAYILHLRSYILLKNDVRATIKRSQTLIRCVRLSLSLCLVVCWLIAPGEWRIINGTASIFKKMHTKQRNFIMKLTDVEWGYDGRGGDELALQRVSGGWEWGVRKAFAWAKWISIFIHVILSAFL